MCVGGGVPTSRHPLRVRESAEGTAGRVCVPPRGDRRLPWPVRPTPARLRQPCVRSRELDTTLFTRTGVSVRTRTLPSDAHFSFSCPLRPRCRTLGSCHGAAGGGRLRPAHRGGLSTGEGPQGPSDGGPPPPREQGANVTSKRKELANEMSVCACECGQTRGARTAPSSRRPETPRELGGRPPCVSAGGHVPRVAVRRGPGRGEAAPGGLRLQRMPWFPWQSRP